MPYAEANQRIQNYVAENGGAEANPMIVYALDSQFLPDALYQKLCDDRDRDRLPKEYPWLLGLFWIRRFYEFGSGNDHLQCLGNGANIDEVRKRIRTVWKLTNPISRDSLIFHCPILKAAEAGGNSQVTRGIEFMVKGLYPDFSYNDFQERKIALIQKQVANLERQVANPDNLAQNEFSKAQINSLCVFTDVFSEIVRTLITGEGESWLSTIAEHPLRMKFRTPQWGVHVNGPVATIAVEVRTSAQEVNFTQGMASLIRRVRNGELIVPLVDFINEGFNFEEEITTPCGPTKLPPLTGIQVARVSRQRHFHSFIELQEDEEFVPEIQAARLYAVLPDHLPSEFTLGGTALPAQSQRLRNCPGHTLVILDLSEVNRSKPVDLRHQGNDPILRIGAAPSLLPLVGENLFELHGDRDTWIVFGDKVNIRLCDYYGEVNQINWSGASLTNGLEATLICGEADYGYKITVRAEIPGRSWSINRSILFLPLEFRDAMIGEKPYTGAGLRWTPECDAAKILASVEHTSRCPGSLSRDNNEPVRISVPSNKIHFWLFKGVSQIGDHAECFVLDPDESFDYLRMKFYLPQGIHHISWGGSSLMKCEGPGFWDERIFPPPKDCFASGANTIEYIITHPDNRVTRIVSYAVPPRVVRYGDDWCLWMPLIMEPLNWKFAILSEQAMGAAVMKSGFCSELAAKDSDPTSGRFLPAFQVHPDQGVALLLWNALEHGSNVQEILEKTQKPTHAFHGPFVLQQSNRFRSQESFPRDLKQDAACHVPLPPWLQCVIQTVRYSFAAQPIGWDDFQLADFTQEGLIHHLDARIAAGDNWIGLPNWGPQKIKDEIARIDTSYSKAPNGNLRRKNPLTLALNSRPLVHSLVGSFHSISQGKRPDTVWLPLSEFSIKYRSADHGFHLLTHLGKNFLCLHDQPARRRKIKFRYGSAVQIEEIGRFDDAHWSSLCWRFSNGKEPPCWWSLTVVGNAAIPSWKSSEDALCELFTDSLPAARHHFGRKRDGNVSELFLRITEWMNSSGLTAERKMLFQTAVLTRLYSWLGNDFGCMRGRDFVRCLVADAWSDQSARQTLIKDIVTVEWTLAWFGYY